MSMFPLRSCLVALAFLLLWPATALAQRLPIETPRVSSRLPLTFVPNAGQVDPSVRYYAKAPGFAVYLTADSAVIAFVESGPGTRRALAEPASLSPDAPREPRRVVRGTALGLRFLDANTDAAVTGRARARGTVNHLIGKDPGAWRTGLATYREVVYPELWPGIDRVFHGGGGKLKYDFVVRPGASVESIRLAYAGADAVSLDDAGNLRIVTPIATVVDERPVSYQTIDGSRVPVDVRLVLGARGANGETPFGFAVRSAYDPRSPLIIDPGLDFSTFLGGSASDFATGHVLDEAGNVYVTGVTTSLDFPISPGAFDLTFNGGDSDVFVAKLSPAGDQLLFATYIGGSNLDRPLKGPVRDSDGNIYVAGQTLSLNFPTTPGALDGSFNGDSDCFVVKLASEGDALVFSTYLGGSGFDVCFAVDVDSQRNVYVTGTTSSANFPTTIGAFDQTRNGGGDGFVTKLAPGGDQLIYSTLLGGSAPTAGVEDIHAIVVDGSGRAHVLGQTDSPDFPTTAGAFDETFNGGSQDAFVATLSAAGDQLLYSTFLGGSGVDRGLALAVDEAGNAYVTGETNSADFPTTPGAFDELPNGNSDAFVVKLGPTRAQLLYSTLLGGSGFDRGAGIAVDGLGHVYVAGWTASADFPATAGSLDESFNGILDAFLAKLSPAGDQLLYATFLGGADSEGAEDVALDGAGSAVLTGFTSSADFPTTAGAFDESFNGGLFDAFVAKITAAPIAPPVIVSNLFLHGSGGTANPPTLTLDDNAPTATAAKYKDSGSANFSGGNPWKQIGTWSALPEETNGSLVALNDLHVWLGLKNSDDQGTRFDVLAEVYKNNVLITSGLTRCIEGITRNPSNAKEATVAFVPFPPANFNGSTDVLALKLLTRIGTNPNETKCPGHNNATGLRLYFDAVTRASQFGAIAP